jgi:hypothetical protein
MPKQLPRALAVALLSTLVPASAAAFCGFYVGGADARLTNGATLVVLMREGTRTALSMQNDYRGPAEDFALVIPVPEVLEQENVQTLPAEVFDHIDQLSSPRLVEYWEQDPCWEPPDYLEEAMGMPVPSMAQRDMESDDLGVTVEAQFEVGEYDIVILSAEDSSGLETWLQQERYNIPDGASAALRPYVEQGTKFFVARVDVERVTFEDGRAVLSPLRVHYDSPELALPIRLGLLNADGAQDLIVHILARGQRYEVANYANVTIPTNLDVADEIRERFPEFYAALFDLTLERNPGAVVTEYAWQATNCDPCPGPVLSQQDLMTLGADVLVEPGGDLMGMVLTRLHHRYTAEALRDDLVFRPAPPIVGGREIRSGPDGALEHGASPSSVNNFQGRYAIRHPWEGPIECDDPVRGRWGGPPQEGRLNEGTGPVRPAQDLAVATRGDLELAAVLRSDVPELDLDAALPETAERVEGSTPASRPRRGGCASCAVGAPVATPWLALLGIAAVVGWRLRRR